MTGVGHGAALGPVLAMWLAMTAVMMAPVVLPWLRALGRVQGPTVLLAFVGGYAVAWTAFSVAAALTQIGLARLGAHAPLTATAPGVAGIALVLVGGFQLTALKDSCLSHCRSPFGYFASHWRPGMRGAWAMGLHHGAFCLGCCWGLMALALVVGSMNLGAMALLMALMLLETLAPFGHRLARPLGLALATWGLLLLLG